MSANLDAALALRLRDLYAARTDCDPDDATMLPPAEAGGLIALGLAPEGDARLAALPLTGGNIQADVSLVLLSPAEIVDHPLTQGFQPTFGAQLGWLLASGAQRTETGAGPVARGRLVIRRARGVLSAVLRLELNASPSVVVAAQFGEEPTTAALEVLVQADPCAVFAVGAVARALEVARGLERPVQHADPFHTLQTAMLAGRAPDTVVH